MANTAASPVSVGESRFRYRVEPSWAIACDRGYGEIPGVACDSRDRVYLFARHQGRARLRP